MTDEGKNIHLVFADESARPMDEIDPDSRTQESIDREKIYDEEISPIMQKLIEKCKEHKMSLMVECEYNPGDFCKTVLLDDEWKSHPVFYTLNAITQCIERKGVNIDKYLFWVLKQVKEAGGHGSMFLSRLGYDFQTGEYNWDQANAMVQGAKPSNHE